MVLLFMVLLPLLLQSLKTQAQSDDFQDLVPPYQIIYHDRQNLLIIVKEDECIFINSTALPPGALELTARNETEALLVRVATGNETGQVERTTLQEVRDAFRDVLADFRCAQDGKAIYIAHNNPFLTTQARELQTRLQELLWCQFEDGLCGWLQGAQDQLNWSLHKGNTSMDGHTGPLADHSIGNARGEYTFLNSSRGKAGDSAQLLSSYLTINSPVCLHFWYSMHGADVNSLAVEVKDESGLEALAWSMSGNQGSGWHEAYVTIQPAGAQTQIVLSATRGASGSGDIAVDDVTVALGPCPASGTSLPYLHIITTTHPPSIRDLMCDFEEGLCNWLQSPEDDGGDWLLQQHNDHSSAGPGTDHTLQSAAGKYAFVVSGQGSVDLLSPYVATPYFVCLQLWVNLNAEHDLTMAVFIKEENGRETELGRLTGFQSQGWTQVRVTIAPMPHEGQQQFVLRATQGQASTSSYVAIDDVTVALGAC